MYSLNYIYLFRKCASYLYPEGLDTFRATEILQRSLDLNCLTLNFVASNEIIVLCNILCGGNAIFFLDRVPYEIMTAKLKQWDSVNVRVRMNPL
jgi:hypothetical protein